MRVVIENFNMTASEMARVWAQQDEYIDLLESQLRKSEENLRKESQRMQMFRWKVTSRQTGSLTTTTILSTPESGLRFVCL